MRKRSTRAVQLDEERIRVFVKGASEIVLDLCKFFIGSEGKPQPLQLADKQKIQEVAIKTYANKAYRTFCLAYKDI